MKKKRFLSIALMVCLLTVFTAAPVFADADSSRVTIGADNTWEDIETVYSYFDINRGDVDELLVTNAEERYYLEGLVPESTIGSVALSCAYIEVLGSGGIEIESHNITWVTDEMYRSALTTAGISDAKVVVAAYKPVSGTGALTGLYKAYEDITGETLDDSYKEVATEELIVTGELQEAIGDVSSDIINDLKAELERTKTMTDDEIRALINEVAARYDATLTADQVEEILGLIKKMNELGIDPDTFLKLVQAGEGVQGFFKTVGDFFQGIGNFFKNLFS